MGRGKKEVGVDLALLVRSQSQRFPNSPHHSICDQEFKGRPVGWNFRGTL